LDDLQPGLVDIGDQVVDALQHMDAQSFAEVRTGFVLVELPAVVVVPLAPGGHAVVVMGLD
jgi:hypothetical protein